MLRLVRDDEEPQAPTGAEREPSQCPITVLAESIDRLVIALTQNKGYTECVRLVGTIPAVVAVPAGPSIAEAVTAWGDHRRLRVPATWAEDCRTILRVAGACGWQTREDAAGGSASFQAWADARKAGNAAEKPLAGRTLNKLARKVSVFLRYIKAPDWAAEFDMFSMEDSGDGSRPLMPGEFARLLQVCDDPVLRSLIVIGRGTGMRSAELRKLQPDVLRKNPPHLAIPRSGSKTKRTRIVPIHPETVAAFEHLGLPLMRPGGKVGKTWPDQLRIRTVARRAKLDRIDELGWYSLRKLYVYERWKQGLSDDDISRLVGNSPGVLGRYLWIEAMDLAERVLRNPQRGSLDTDGFDDTLCIAEVAPPQPAHESNTPRPVVTLRPQQSKGDLKGRGYPSRAKEAGESETQSVGDARGRHSSAVERRFCKASVPIWALALQEALTVFVERLASPEGLDDGHSRSTQGKDRRGQGRAG